MEAKDNTPLLGGLMVAMAMIVIVGVGAFIVAGRGAGDSIQTVAPAPSAADKTSRPSGNDPTAPSSSSAASQVRSGEVVVEISNLGLSPAAVTVKRGTTVTWKNRDNQRHAILGNQNVPDKIDSGLLANNESYSYTFNTVGTFAYYCAQHPNMKGSVTVVE